MGACGLTATIRASRRETRDRVTMRRLGAGYEGDAAIVRLRMVPG
jgi:hypothetical protein